MSLCATDVNETVVMLEQEYRYFRYLDLAAFVGEMPCHQVMSRPHTRIAC
jgi:hypothetical protein